MNNNEKLRRFLIEHPIHKHSVQSILEYCDMPLEVAEPILNVMINDGRIEVVDIFYLRLRDKRIAIDYVNDRGG